MNQESKIIISRHSQLPRETFTYITGFVISLYLTLTAYTLVVHRYISSANWLIAAVIALAIIQFSVQLIYFLHLGKEVNPQWRLLVFILMLVIVFIIVGGSLWIMSNLNYATHLTTGQMERYMNNQDGL